MYLDKVEIHGFKSFGDAVKLSIPQGITGVIGPNGMVRVTFQMRLDGCLENKVPKAYVVVICKILFLQELKSESL